MTDNFDNLQSFPDDESEGGTLRWMSIVIAIMAIGGFFSLAWYAYHAGTASMGTEEVPTITAENTPVKEAPEEPGGWQVPHQDKTVYEAIAPESEKKETVEKIMAAPEEPVEPVAQAEPATPEPAAAEPASGNGETIDTSSEETKTPSVLSENNPTIVVKGEEVVQTPDGKVTTSESSSTPAVKDTPPPPAQIAQPESEQRSSSIKIIDVTKEGKTTIENGPKRIDLSAPSAAPSASPAERAAEQPQEVKTVAVASVETSHEAKTVTPSGTGSSKVRVQLGAYKSESEAVSSWNKISKKFSSLGGKDHVITRADLGAKGVYYRLQVMPFADMADARSMCGQLSAQNQGCLPVKVP